jgi:hypothetical protein
MDMTIVVSAALALAPVLMIWGLLRLSDRVALRRELRFARQIALTDAIHRELGAVAAPTVERRAFGRWRVAMAVSPDRPSIVGALVRITAGAFAEWDGAQAAPVQIVMTPSREAARAEPVQTLRPVPARAATPSIAA